MSERLFVCQHQAASSSSFQRKYGQVGAMRNVYSACIIHSGYFYSSSSSCQWHYHRHLPVGWHTEIFLKSLSHRGGHLWGAERNSSTLQRTVWWVDRISIWSWEVITVSRMPLKSCIIWLTWSLKLSDFMMLVNWVHSGSDRQSKQISPVMTTGSVSTTKV